MSPKNLNPAIATELRLVRRHLVESLKEIDFILDGLLPLSTEQWPAQVPAGDPKLSYLALVDAAFRQTALLIEEQIRREVADGARLDEMRIINRTDDGSQELWVGDRKSLRVTVSWQVP